MAPPSPASARRRAGGRRTRRRRRGARRTSTSNGRTQSTRRTSRRIRRTRPGAPRPELRRDVDHHRDAGLAQRRRQRQVEVGRVDQHGHVGAPRDRRRGGRAATAPAGAAARSPPRRGPSPTAPRCWRRTPGRRRAGARRRRRTPADPGREPAQGAQAGWRRGGRRYASPATRSAFTAAASPAQTATPSAAPTVSASRRATRPRGSEWLTGRPRGGHRGRPRRPSRHRREAAPRGARPSAPPGTRARRRCRVARPRSEHALERPGRPAGGCRRRRKANESTAVATRVRVRRRAIGRLPSAPRLSRAGTGTSAIPARRRRARGRRTPSRSRASAPGAPRFHRKVKNTATRSACRSIRERWSTIISPSCRRTMSWMSSTSSRFIMPAVSRKVLPYSHDTAVTTPSPRCANRRRKKSDSRAEVGDAPPGTRAGRRRGA